MEFGASSRRRFLGYFSGIGLSSTLFPGLLWSRMLDSQAPEVTLAMIRDAGALSGLDLTEDQAEALVEGVNRNLQGYTELREYKLWRWSSLYRAARISSAGRHTGKPSCAYRRHRDPAAGAPYPPAALRLLQRTCRKSQKCP